MKLKIKDLANKLGIGESKVRTIIARPEFEKYRTSIVGERSLCMAFEYNEESKKALLKYQITTSKADNEILKEKLYNIKKEIDLILSMLK